MQGPGGGSVRGSGQGRVGPELFLHPCPLAARDRGGGAGAQVCPVPPSPALLPCSRPWSPSATCSFMPLLHQIVHLTRSTGWWRTRPRVSLWSPCCLPGWNQCHPEGQKLKQCLWCQSVTFFWCATWIPGLVVLLPMSGSRLCTALPAPSTTAAHAGAEETPSPKNRWEHPSWKGGGTAWRDQKGKQSKEKSNVHQHSRASSLLLYHCPEFFPRNRIKTGMAENCHFILTMTVKTTNMQIAIVYSIYTFSLKTTSVETRFQRCVGKTCAWLGRAAGPAARGSADPSGKAGVHKCNPDFEIWGGEGTPPCKSSSPPQGSRRQPRTSRKEGINTDLIRGLWWEPSAWLSPSLLQQNSARTFYAMCFNLLEVKKQIPLFSSVFKLHSLCGHISGIARNIFYYCYIKKTKYLLE